MRKPNKRCEIGKGEKERKINNYQIEMSSTFFGRKN